MGILSPADVRCHGVGNGIVQYIAVHGAVLFAGDVLRVRPCGVQRLQALQPGQRGGLRFGAVQRFRLLHIAAGLLHRAGQSKAQKRHLRLEVPEDHRRMFRRRRGGQGKGVPERCHPVCAGARAGVLLHRLFQGHGAGVAPLKLRNHRSGGGLLIGALGGFAPAAVAASEAVRTGQLTSRQASALLPACVCSGPSFVILTVGQQMLGSRAVGVRLFAAQLLAGYLTAALLCRMQGGAGQAPPAQGETIPLPALDAVIAQAAVTYLKLCGFVLYFRLLAAGCGALLPQPWAALPAMLLEVCSGCDQAARTGLWASTLCCAALSVQGVSVLLQVRTICPAEISLRPLLAARAVHLPLSVALFWLGSTVPVQAVQTFTTLTERVVVLRRVPLDCALLAFAVCCITVEELARS